MHVINASPPIAERCIGDPGVQRVVYAFRWGSAIHWSTGAMRRQDPHTVFTPRSGEVNEKMFVPRKELESALANALRGTKHILIHGQSGCGKSWLYKHRLSADGFRHLVAYMDNACRLGGLDAELRNLVERTGVARKRGYEEEKKAELGVVVKGKLGHTAKFEIGQKEPFEECLVALRNDAGSAPAFLVFENCESFSDYPDVRAAVTQCLLLLDAQHYAGYDVRLILVGVPKEIEKYFSAQGLNLATVVNRLTEIPEVGSLLPDEMECLVHRGLIEYLGLDVDYEEYVMECIGFITSRIPQYVQELCLEIALCASAEQSNRVTKEMLATAVCRWAQQSFSAIMPGVEEQMECDARTDMLSQVAYVVSRLDKEEFTANDVVEHFGLHPPQDTQMSPHRITQALEKMASGPTPLIQKRSAVRGSYGFVLPQYRLCIRAFYDLDEGSGRVFKKSRDLPTYWLS